MRVETITLSCRDATDFCDAWRSQTLFVPKSSPARAIVAENVSAAIEASGQSLRSWSESRGMHPEQVRRAAKGLGLTLESLQDVAGAVGVPPWRLLLPAMRLPPPDASPKAAELAALYDAIPEKEAQRRAYAIARLALTDSIPDPSRPDEADEPPERVSAPKPKRQVVR